MPFLTSLILGTATATAAAADLPLGQVAAVQEKNQVEVVFDQDHQLIPDRMLAIYGPGKVEKHPLTKQVVTEQRALVAKAQVIQVDGRKVKARLTWIDKDTAIKEGYDAVPMPGEASPDCPPVLISAAVPEVEAAAQDTVIIRLPVQDPEGGPLACRWRLEGERGTCGRLAASTSGDTENLWSAPARAGKCAAVVIVSDAAGQTLEVKVPLKIGEVGENWRQRDLKPFATMGGKEAGWTWLDRADDGWWWAIVAGREVRRIDPGFGRMQPIHFQANADVREPRALVPTGNLLHVLDGSRKAILSFALDGVLRGTTGAFAAPTDLALDRDGAFYVADQDLGGVQVYEPNGTFRCCLGRKGDGRDGFKRLSRLALGADGTCYCLDADQKLIQRFDRFHRRLPTWDIQVDAEKQPIDLAVHPKGLLVLLSNGQVLVYNANGLAPQSLPALATDKWFEAVRDPASLNVDRLGSVFVTYPGEGLTARYDLETRQINGVRGSNLWTNDLYAADGQGRLYALNIAEYRVSVFDGEGWLTGRFGGRVSDGGVFERPKAMTVSADGRNLLVLDERRYCVLRFNLDQIKDRPLVVGQRGEGPGQFDSPVSVSTDLAGRIYVLDSDLYRVSVFNAEGQHLFDFGRKRGSSKDREGLYSPTLVAVTPNGDMGFIFDEDRYEIRKYLLDQAGRKGTHEAMGGGRGRELGQFQGPVGLACDHLGLLYVVDGSRNDVQVVDFRGSNPIAVLATPLRGILDETPTGLALSLDGLAWVAGRQNLLGLQWTRRK